MGQWMIYNSIQILWLEIHIWNFKEQDQFKILKSNI